MPIGCWKPNSLMDAIFKPNLVRSITGFNRYILVNRSCRRNVHSICILCYILHVNQIPLKPDQKKKKKNLIHYKMAWHEKKSLLNKDDPDQSDSRELESESKYGVNH